MFKENSSRHISITKTLDQKISIIQPNFRMTFFVTEQTAFHHCTFQFITAHFVHHCTLKEALGEAQVFFKKITPDLRTGDFAVNVGLWVDAESRLREIGGS